MTAQSTCVATRDTATFQRNNLQVQLADLFSQTIDFTSQLIDARVEVVIQHADFAVEGVDGLRELLTSADRQVFCSDAVFCTADFLQTVEKIIQSGRDAGLA